MNIYVIGTKVGEHFASFVDREVGTDFLVEPSDEDVQTVLARVREGNEDFDIILYKLVPVE